MEKQRPEIVHDYETSVHEAFYRSLLYCSSQTDDIGSPHFSQCIKASGINFATAYEQFFDYKVRRIQNITHGIND